MAKKNSDEVPVNWGNLLESKLEGWRGGRTHAKGIAEYISNSDDSYRRLKRFNNQIIEVEIHSRRGRKIDKLIVRDFAEGMSYSDLQDKFFQYFESASGRDKGQPVSGRFGTGGKAYAIMNFRHCWITSVKDGLENRAWFKWDSERKKILRDYNKGGYKDKPVKKPNQTIVELQDSLKVTQELLEVVGNLEKLARIRHVIKSQKVSVRLCKKREDDTLSLMYDEPKNALKQWELEVPAELCETKSERSRLTLQYFQKPLENSFIDLSDGISSVADLKVESFDGRPFSRYFNGHLTLRKLKDSTAVKENRKGLEEGDDLTDAIEAFLKDSICKVVSEVEEEQRRKERERRLSASNEKMRELSKFLKKCELNFKEELKELKKRVISTQSQQTDDEPDDDNHTPIYRKPTDDDPRESLVRGTWITGNGNPGPGPSPGISKFIPSEDGLDFAVLVGLRRTVISETRKVREGLRVIMSDDPNIAEQDRRVFGEFDDPVDDRDMVSKGIIWINANHPTIVERRTKNENDPVFLEMVANYVLMIVAQYHAQRQYDAEPDEEKSDPILLFRQKFFKLERDLREDNQISYFATDYESESPVASPTEEIAGMQGES
jgi:Histidine kinase-, DNA gyrase B-, and HSP90-like ATPase